MHDGRIVALDSPGALRARLGEQLLEVRAVDGADDALPRLRERGLADADAFAIGQTLYVPLRRRSAADAVTSIERAGIRTTSVATREPTLDDVYLRLTGGQLAA